MKIWLKTVIFLAVLLISILMALFGLLSYLTSDLCENEIYSEIVSPDENYKAIIFQRDCGASTGFSTQISIVEAGDNLSILNIKLKKAGVLLKR
jgi:hypothetical protein